MDVLKNLIDAVGLGGFSTFQLIALAAGAFLVLGGGKLDFSAILAYVKNLVPKAATVISNAAASSAEDRLAAARLIYLHLKEVGAPEDSFAAFDQDIAPYLWRDSK